MARKKLTEFLLGLALKQEVFITAINAIVGWIVYNLLISIYGFSWSKAVIFGLIGYVFQVLMFRWLIWFMRSIEAEVKAKVEGQTKLTDYLEKKKSLKGHIFTKCVLTKTLSHLLPTNAFVWTKVLVGVTVDGF
ncbi:hypothetical protein B9P99_06240 [Candidatus Marsarchaeota G1 archaeon OSP_B]|jgi:hypothetical protein|uniref:Uncharacterized protein n=1 Tax=Candidatus Marsarchaeota G1 archaeon OSP_B TaxID=1978153 RepID=A0A2R6AN35_9ARCH|nr:MAG: hypothetical protein B9P99_06240 [Candidatus Marsarchaeota G1 archaeon OSP_B]